MHEVPKVIYACVRVNHRQQGMCMKHQKLVEQNSRPVTLLQLHNLQHLSFHTHTSIRHWFQTFNFLSAPHITRSVITHTPSPNLVSMHTHIYVQWLPHQFRHHSQKSSLP